ncbi:MAG: Holliday junction resolvase RuvX [Alicyclobacillaceae bacterium]|jgi:putative Holliday junction resolvase|nr:Holliday junction resolvase RuvX [Alicyclobacillaceae bacterium]MCY0895502.1 Holliday junction resolvase RuvX [Alicyclobacillaceae bacterium]
MRVLGVDYGTVRIGLSLSDPTGCIAQAHGFVAGGNDKKAASDLLKMVQDFHVERIVVGVPLHMNGSESELSAKARQFGALLERVCGVTVVYVDERLTTVTAERMLVEADVRRSKRKGVVDSVAATVLLQSYLDSPAARR